MLKNRMIPVVLLRNGVVVQSKGFSRYQRLGNPTAIVQRLSDWAADELIYLDISKQQVYDLGRGDLNVPNRGSILEILSDVASKCFMPLTFGGGIRTLDDALSRIRAGADKITINTIALENPDFIDKASREFGSQCIVVSVDVRRNDEGGWTVFTGGGSVTTDLSVVEWVKEAEQRGAGEILINSIDRDGSGLGYDLDLVTTVIEAVNIPVIACGGVGRWDHLREGLAAGASAVAAANIFHYTENSVYKAKQLLWEWGLNVREPTLGGFSRRQTV